MENAKKEIDHEFTDEIVCPYCGCEYTCSYEFRSDNSEEECQECGKTFAYERIININYTTKKMCTCGHSEGMHWRKDTSCGESHADVDTYKKTGEWKRVHCPCKEFKSI